MIEHDGLPRTTRGVMLLIALLSGCLLYLAEQGMRAGCWPFTTPLGRVAWYSLVISLPLLLLLSVRRLDERGFWWRWLLLAAGLSGLSAWAGWSISGVPSPDASAVLAPYVLSVGWALFVLLAFVQVRSLRGDWQADYPLLLQQAWQNGLTLLLAGLFVAVCWALLWLWGQLFVLLELPFFRELFGQRLFVYVATALMAGLGLLIGRTQQRALQIIRQVLFALCKGLLPLVAFIAALFVLSLPFTGLESLWRTRMAVAILLSLQLVMVLLLNAVRQEGTAAVPYPAPLRRSVELGLLCLPLLAGLALYALYLRIAQYGWTAERLWVVSLALLLAGHAIGYVIAVFRHHAGWLHEVGRTNIALAWLSLGWVVAANSPLLDPHRLAVASQLARARESGWSTLDLNYLRFDSGIRGYRALLALRDDRAIRADAALTSRLAQLLVADSPAAWGPPGMAQLPPSIAQLRARIRLGPGVPPPQADYLEALRTGRITDAGCLQQAVDCLLLNPDLRGDGQRQLLLCALDIEPVRCALAVPSAEGWQAAGSVVWSGSSFAAVRQALRRGELRPRQPSWPELEAAGQRAAVHPAEAVSATAAEHIPH